MSDPFEEIAALPEPLRSRIESGVTLHLCIRFYEFAAERRREAEVALRIAQHRLIDAQEYEARTSVTLEQATRLHAAGRT